ncbi:hypothetical protein M885DRAFT_590491 [Pelagophyceae sp. CCMP2097]|nr:hypothetical protein M885DRAFT_590491 [Pelagophyceae sp. CCMP2097]
MGFVAVLRRLACCGCLRRGPRPEYDIEEYDANAVHPTDNPLVDLEEGSHSPLVGDDVKPNILAQDDAVLKSGPSVAERRQMLRDSTKSNAEALPRRPSAGLKKAALLRSRTVSKACALCGLDVFPGMDCEKSKKDPDKTWYHAKCFKCAACGRSLRGTQHGQLAEGDDVLYCDERIISCLRRLSNASNAQTAEKESENQRLSETDIGMVKSARGDAVLQIGDDLERIVGRGAMAPKCALCGGPFAAKDRLVIEGMRKSHEYCVTGNVPSGAAKGGAMPRERALGDAPATILLKLKLPTATPKVVTFFAVRGQLDATQAQLKALTGLEYIADPTSNAPPTRKSAEWDASGKCELRCVGTSGKDLAPLLTQPVCATGDVSMHFSWTAAGLDWALTAHFTLDARASTVTFRRAFLAVEAQNVGAALV